MADPTSPVGHVAAHPEGWSGPVGDLPEPARTRARALDLTYLAGSHVLDPLHEAPCVAVWESRAFARLPVVAQVPEAGS